MSTLTNVFKLVLPYCIQKVGNGYVFLNRKYKPVGFNIVDGFINYQDYPVVLPISIGSEGSSLRAHAGVGTTSRPIQIARFFMAAGDGGSRSPTVPRRRRVGPLHPEPQPRAHGPERALAGVRRLAGPRPHPRTPGAPRPSRTVLQRFLSSYQTVNRTQEYIMSINDFIDQLQALAGQPDRWLPRHPTVHVAVNNAAKKRPSAALIEVAGAPGLALLAGDLQADYAGRTLVLGRQVWRAGDRSTTKRALSDLLDAFLADLAVDLDAPLPEPVGYVGTGT